MRTVGGGSSQTNTRLFEHHRISVRSDSERPRNPSLSRPRRTGVGRQSPFRPQPPRAVGESEGTSKHAPVGDGLVLLRGRSRICGYRDVRCADGRRGGEGVLRRPGCGSICPRHMVHRSQRKRCAFEASRCRAQPTGSSRLVMSVPPEPIRVGGSCAQAWQCTARAALEIIPAPPLALAKLKLLRAGRKRRRRPALSHPDSWPRTVLQAFRRTRTRPGWSRRLR